MAARARGGIDSGDVERDVKQGEVGRRHGYGRIVPKPSVVTKSRHPLHNLWRICRYMRPYSGRMVVMVDYLATTGFDVITTMPVEMASPRLSIARIQDVGVAKSKTTSRPKLSVMFEPRCGEMRSCLSISCALWPETAQRLRDCGGNMTLFNRCSFHLRNFL